MSDTDREAERVRGGLVAGFIAVMDKLSFAGGILSALCLMTLVVMITAEIVVASVSKVVPWFPSNIPVAWEYTGYLLGATFLLGSSMTLRTGGHIRLGVLIDNLHGGKRRAVEAVASVIGVIFSGFMFWALLQFTIRSFERGTLSPQSFTPLWIPQAVLVFGALLLFLQMIARLLACLADLPLDNVKMRPKTLED